MNAKQRRVKKREYFAEVGHKLVELRLLGASPAYITQLSAPSLWSQTRLSAALIHFRNKPK